MYNVYIRPLANEDSQVSWRWRNDPEVWKYTGSKPDRLVTHIIESDWIIKVLKDTDSKRFAIIVDDNYVGNIQLTNINCGKAQYHIFIGDKNYWGKGIAQLATFQILSYAKEILNLNEVYLHVNNSNISAIRVYEKNGFLKQDVVDTDVKMVCVLENMLNPTVSIFCMVYNHEKYISECLEGFLFQKCNFNYTIVLGEDFSRDNSRNIILEYVEKYPGKFKLLLHNENVGANKNQELVFKNCHGKYIAMCEGDDYWTDPLKLQKQVDSLEENPTLDICSHVSRNFNDDIKKDVGIVGDNGKEVKVIPTLEVILRFGYVCPMQSILIRKNRIDEFKTLTLNAFGGHGIMQVLWSHPNGVLYLPDVMGVYRSNSENSITKKVLTNKEYYLDVLKTQIEKLKELDAHFNFIYTKEFFVKISEVNQKILRSRIITEYEKLKFIRDNKLKMSFTQILFLLKKGWFSKIKYNFLKIGVVKSIIEKSNVY